MNIRKLVTWVAGAATLALAACGGGGSSGGIGGTGGGGGGIGGTGVAYGTITAFGSVWVNGVEYGTGSTTFKTDDHPNGGATQGDLRIGMVVRVDGSVSGKRADVIIVDLNRLHSTPRPAELASTLVYSTQSSDVLTVIIDGGILMRDRILTTLDEQQVIDEANQEATLLMKRAGV